MQDSFIVKGCTNFWKWGKQFVSEDSEKNDPNLNPICEVHKIVRMSTK